MGVVSTIPEKCRRCFTCVRECPAKAIKVGPQGQAEVLDERCIACGNCVKVCAQKAKRIEDATAWVERLLARGGVYACVAPSFPAAFVPVAPERVIGAIRRLGFAEVWEVAFGAELVSRAYVRLFDEARRAGKRVVSTPCPAIVAYVEKFMPELDAALAPIVSPMIAVARAIRLRRGADARIVFIGPCIAKKIEAADPAVQGEIDAVLTFRDLERLFGRAGVLPETAEPSEPDGPPSGLGRTYPLSGGLLKASGLSTDILENEIIVTEGKERAISALRELASGRSRARLLDVLFCEGCINGPKMPNELSVFARKELVADYVRSRAAAAAPGELEAALAAFDGLDLSRTFTRQNLVLPMPPEEAIARALADMHKVRPEDQLNCGACGYPTCREKAVAVCQGLAEAEMCLPYLIEELEATCERLDRSRQDLESTQHRLVQTERLASMGQLSAGIAHEINNPLGTILLYSHMLLKQAGQAGAEARPDLEMIVSEATRCKTIVRGLLDFARQSRLSKEPVALAALIEEVGAILRRRLAEAGARFEIDVPAGFPSVMLDGNQMRQVLVNLVDNAADAVAGRDGGRVTVAARWADGGRRAVRLTVSDNGCGIAEEHLGKLFDPFFTTKEMGKGTGLGLAIAYGIVKMHAGDIQVQSRVGEGTMFTIVLPVEAAGVVEPAGEKGRGA